MADRSANRDIRYSARQARGHRTNPETDTTEQGLRDMGVKFAGKVLMTSRTYLRAISPRHNRRRTPSIDSSDRSSSG
jgi:hypothetical protein